MKKAVMVLKTFLEVPDNLTPEDLQKWADAFYEDRQIPDTLTRAYSAIEFTGAEVSIEAEESV